RPGVLAAEVAIRATCDGEPGGVDGHGICRIALRGPELASPQHLARAVVLADDRVGVVRRGAAGERAPGRPDDDDPGPVGGDRARVLVLRRPELPGPQDIALPVVAADEQ